MGGSMKVRQPRRALHGPLQVLKEHTRALSRIDQRDRDGEHLGYHEVLDLAEALFPPATHPRVLDVAGGRGLSTRLFRDAGYEVTLLDSGDWDSVCGTRHVRRAFTWRDADHYDLLVGLAPCEATQEFLRAAKRVPAIFGPCGCWHIWPKRHQKSGARSRRATSSKTHAMAQSFMAALELPFVQISNLYLLGPAAELLAERTR